MYYLGPQVDIVEIWYTTDKKSREHQWANHLAAHRLSFLPLNGFGASDCSCIAHLAVIAGENGNSGTPDWRRSDHWFWTCRRSTLFIYT